MLKSDQQEKVLTTTMIHFIVNHEHFKNPPQKQTSEGLQSTDKTRVHFTSETKVLWIPNTQPKTMKSKSPFQKQKSDGFSVKQNDPPQKQKSERS
jgi:hypothetical protein